MELQNRLPFPAMAFRQFDAEGGLDCIVSVRATFVHVQDGSLDVAAEQESFQWEDAYEGDPHQTVLLRQSDLTPDKPGTDISFLGDTWSPSKEPQKSWRASIRVGKVFKEIEVFGRRFWQPVVKEKWAGFSAREAKRVIADWKLNDPEPARNVAIGWHSAYGGAIPHTGNAGTETPIDVERRNPLGCGIVNLEMSADAGPVPAPQIAAVGEHPDWRSPPEPQGLGLVSPWWQFRQQYSGTYDDGWREERHPLLPRDFDPRFWQAAHPDLIATPHLKGDENYELTNLSSEHPVAKGSLPGLTLGVHCLREDRDEWYVLKLDGVQFDWRNDGRVLLTWRIRFPLPDAGDTKLILTRVRLKSPEAEAALTERETA
ncbi:MULTISPECIES: DUF2169 domain-containing protein [unclassified Agrobacterium]|uniref:DUF2169 family type VI secretion system accessory protein n=1 Tax=unclassified Agrobacterium TaxID=2632611 RepID=UPI00244AACA7|nr:MULTISPECIES: DUF2169 domain-containing protein [unclassified Agrobacterium]MDH0615205.1 DUF2169 domain-containing protein [Agrobacterium sp. GD03872]MDH0698252.1 DUF2169 domain-containing protein [Agrobacterium sp. GD03871]MDH1060278.1 DUF2169 domain-containing protein [Agrobacterium sp. GD03992]MDH2212034.1 DUF2169 domain-containing protein [Agrobacterium sp. GD03643]MDH2220253.1 DUF2169 domain-containing protein [Agrobacterium sp. GD03638]